MNTRHPLRALPPALLVAACLATPVVAMAASDYSEADRRELEDRLRQDEFQRQMDQRTRMQEEALRGQEQALRRLEEARARLEQNSREVAQLSSQLGRDVLIGYSTAAGAGVDVLPLPRSVLGVSVDSSTERSDGALVRQVSPGGPAAEAGIRAGDLIVSLRGEDLTRAGRPARELVEKMGQIAPDTKVQVGVLRDGKRMNFDVTARAPAPALRTEQFRRYRDLADEMRDLPRPGTDSDSVFPRIHDVGGSNALSGMEFATISEGLGKYFGVKTGVLVVRAGANAPFSLRDGDVILSIDGREPTNAQHVGRILRSYQPGEKLKLRVQRDGKPIDIDTTGGNPRR